MMRRPILLLSLLTLLSSCTFPAAEGPPTLDSLRALPLQSAFEAVAEQAGVPDELLLAIAWHNTSLDPIQASHSHGGKEGDGPEHGPSHGWLGLNNEQIEWAASLSGLDVEQVREDPVANLVAGAALIAELAGPADADTPGAAWWPAVVALADLPEAWLADEHALDVFETLQRGLDVVTDAGEAIAFEGRDLPSLEEIDPLEGPSEESGDFSSVQGFPGRAQFLPAHWSNYTAGRSSSIRRIIIHTTEGSYQSTLSWFRNPSANVSAHYTVRRSDGEITQQVRDNHMGWHACAANADTIGIEHEGRAGQASTWTEANLDASARLSGWLTRKYNIPVDRAHIVGHGEVTPSSCPGRWDPGPHFPWGKYMRMVKYYKQQGWQAANFGLRAEIDIKLPRNGQQVGQPFAMRVGQKHAHHLSVWLGARMIHGDVRGDFRNLAITPVRRGWQKLKVKAHRRNGAVIGKKTIRVRVRKSRVDVDPTAQHIHDLDYQFNSVVDGDAAYVRYWLNGRSVRDLLSDRKRAKPHNDFRLRHEFENKRRRLLVARAYDDTNKLIGEGWRHVRPKDEPGEPARIDQAGADTIVGNIMRLHAEAMPNVHWIEWFIDGEPVADFETGAERAWPSEFELFVTVDEPGEHALKAKAYDVTGNRRHTVNRTLHAPAPTIELNWERTGNRKYRFDADAPAGTERVVFHADGDLFEDVDHGDGYAPAPAFRIEHRFSSTGPVNVTAQAFDQVGNSMGMLEFPLVVE